MKIKKIIPHRVFQVGKKKNNIFLKDTLKISIKNSETCGFQIKKQSKLKFQFHNWGFIINNSLEKKNFYTFLFIGGKKNKIHLALYLKRLYKKFNKYCLKEELQSINIKHLINEIKKNKK